MFAPPLTGYAKRSQIIFMNPCRIMHYCGRKNPLNLWVDPTHNGGLIAILQQNASMLARCSCRNFVHLSHACFVNNAKQCTADILISQRKGNYSSFLQGQLL